MMTTPETKLAQEALRGLLTLAADLPNDSPFQQTRIKLGDRFNETAIDAIRQNTARALADDFNRDAIEHALPGLPVGQMVMADIIAGALKDIVAAAKSDDGSSPNAN
jgi:hypothetical protein